MDHESCEREKVVKCRPRDISIFSQRPKVYKILKAVLIKRQTQYSTTISKDIKLLEAADLAKRHRLAVEVRLGEKELLAAALQEVEKVLKKTRTQTGGRRQEVQNTAVKRQKLR